MKLNTTQLTRIYDEDRLENRRGAQGAGRRRFPHH